MTEDSVFVPSASFLEGMEQLCHRTKETQKVEKYLQMQKWGCIMKKIISLSLCAAIFVGCGIPACAEFRGNQIMSAQEEARIMERYEQEMEYIAIASNTAIDHIDGNTIDAIKSVSYGPAFHNEAYQFDEMMREIALAVMDYRDEQTVSVRGTIIPGTYSREIVASGRLYASVNNVIPVGATYSYAYTDSITVAVGANVQGYSLSTEYTHATTVTTSFSGPEDGTKLVNGKYATGRIVFVIVSGNLIHEQWDYIIDYGQLEEIDSYFIESTTASTSIHTTLSCFSVSSSYWGIETENRAQVRTYSSETAALNDLRTYPNRFV